MLPMPLKPAVVATLLAWGCAAHASDAPNDSFVGEGFSPSLATEQQEPELFPVPQKNTLPAQPQKTDELPSVSSAELLANPELLEHALYSSVVLGNVPAVQKLLPLYRQTEKVNDKAGVLLVQMSGALLAKNSGELKTAIRLYREVVAAYPQMNDVRFALAAALFDDKQDEAAKDQFERLRGDDGTSTQEQAVIEQYLQTLSQRSHWDFGGGINYIYDPNINDAPNKRTAQLNGGTWTFAKPESAHGIGYYAQAGKDWNIKNNVYLSFGSELNGKSYWANHSYDDISVQARLGISYKDARTEAAVLPYYSKRWYGGERYTHETGVRGEWSSWLKPKHRLSIAGEIGKEIYEQNEKLNGISTSGSFTWLWLDNVRRYWTLGADIGSKNAPDQSRAYHRYGIRGSWTQEWQHGISSSLSLSASRRHYHAPDLLNIKRSETDYQARLSLWSRKIHYWGITPRLTFSYRHTQSNHPGYTSSKFSTFIQLGKSF